MGHDPLVEALEARGEKRELALLRELFDERLVELPALGRQRDDSRRPALSVDALERGVDDVHPEDHARAAAVRIVVDLPRPERGRVAVVQEPELELAAEDGRERLLLRQPAEGVRNLREDVDAHGDAGYPLAWTLPALPRPA